MNFQFTKGKTIISIIIALLFGLYVFLDTAKCIGSSEYCINASHYSVSLVYTVIAFGLTHLILSLLQKKS